MDEQTQSGTSGAVCRKRWRLVYRSCLCILTAVIACAGCAIGCIKLFFADAIDGDDQIRIYIDQGHNPSPYHNSGAQGNGLCEQDLTYQIGLLLAERLRADGRFEVRLSRPNADTVLGSDNTSSLQARVEEAAEFKADYLISLHINSFTEDFANGIEVYSLSASGEAYDLGSAVLNGMVEATGLNNRGMKQNAQLYLLKNASMPALLLEMGFISNEGDAALLAEHPELFAQGIYNGILSYFGLS